MRQTARQRFIDYVKSLDKRERARLAKTAALLAHSFHASVLTREAHKMKGKSAEEITAMIGRHFTELASRGGGALSIVLDHRSSLLKEARMQARNGQSDFA